MVGLFGDVFRLGELGDRLVGDTLDRVGLFGFVMCGILVAQVG